MNSHPHSAIAAARYWRSFTRPQIYKTKSRTRWRVLFVGIAISAANWRDAIFQALQAERIAWPPLRAKGKDRVICTEGEVAVTWNPAEVLVLGQGTSVTQFGEGK